MNTYDLTPLFRSTIGFDRMSRLLESALKIDGTAQNYPPHNIVKTGDNDFRISIALAGFREGDVEVAVGLRLRARDVGVVVHVHRRSAPV